MKFEQVKKGLEEGKIFTRDNWPAPRRIIFCQVNSEINKTIVPKMQSLPQALKDVFESRFVSGTHDSIYYADQLAIVDANNVIRGYTPSVEDIFALDWKEITT